MTHPNERVMYGGHVMRRSEYEAQLEKETVNHPAHYGGDTPYEAIKVIEAWKLGFSLGNAVKYIARAEHKGSQLEDLQKAAWYLQHEIERLGGEPASEPCTHAWEEINPGHWMCKELCGFPDIDLTRSPDWSPPVEMSPGAFMEVGPIETADPDARPGADRARWAYDDAKVKLERLMAVVPAPDVTYAICGAIGRNGKCVFAKSHQSICRNSNGLGIS